MYVYKRNRGIKKKLFGDMSYIAGVETYILVGSIVWHNSILFGADSFCNVP